MYRTALTVLAIPIGAYAALSLSMFTVGGLLNGSVTFMANQYLRKGDKGQKGPLVLLLMIVIGIYGAIPVVDRTFRNAGKVGHSFEMQAVGRTGDDDSLRKKILRNEIPGYAASRLSIWQFYIDEIASGGNELAF